MPIMYCEVNGKPGYKYGDSGACYTYEPGNARSQADARMKAEAQMAAIKANDRPDAKAKQKGKR